jgi:transaldolase
MSEIFLDTASIEEINKFKSWGIGTGVTTNQKIFLKTAKGTDFKEQAEKILDAMYPYPVSLEGPNDLGELLDKAEVYRTWGRNVVVKVPMLGNGDGLKAVKILSSMGIQTNVTACMTVNQAFLAANAGATYVSLFYNRMKDMKDEKYAIETIKRTMLMLHDGGFDTELIVGSIRTPEDIPNILEGQPDIITIPTKILEQMPLSKKTEETLEEFEKAWEKYQKSK